ncbi:MAG: ATP synthase F1 subunit delta [Deltaproteobacteria bacterium]|nr:ATP synthase F1 subunit delta [Deltaproteobacteria bacterium]MBW2447615.1 ATP synthase F1 subunit delta [Deltaproteobacteria bacterium]
MASSTAAGRRYAKALFGIAKEDDSIEATGNELSALAALFDSSPELQNVLFRPLHPVAERRAALRAVAERLGSSATLQNFYAFLVDQRRLIDFPTICAEFARLAAEAEGRTDARITSARPLDDATRERLVEALSQRTGKKVHVEVNVDPSLIGGVVAQVGGLVFDGSLRTQLEQLRTNLTKD